MKGFKTLRVRANAKVNLHLDVLGKRDDGFHDIVSVMQSISLSDEVHMMREERLQLTSNEGPLITLDNLVWKAANRLAEVKRPPCGAWMTLMKSIPIGAGLAGGSADAAAALAGLNILWELGLSEDELAGIGLEIGSDVPFCLKGGTMLAEGRGERLTSAKLEGDWMVVLASPDIKIETAATYALLDEKRVPALGAWDQVKDAFSEGRTADGLKLAGNVFQELVAADHGDIAKLIEAALGAGADKALMSGTGPSVLAVTQDEETAAKVVEAMEGTCERVGVFEPVDAGLEVSFGEEEPWKPVTAETLMEGLPAGWLEN